MHFAITLTKMGSNYQSRTMKPTFKTLPVFTALLAAMPGFFSTVAAAQTTIIFSNQTTITDAFPTSVTSGMESGPTYSTNRQGVDVVELIAGDPTLLDANRRGQITIYSTNSYSSSLDFITSGGLSLTVSSAMLNTPRGTTWGKIGITSDNTGTMSSANGIYLFFDRASTAANNTVRLMQSINGVESTLATLISGNVGNMFDAQTFSLSLTETNWSMTLVTQGQTGIIVSTNTASGVFDTAWTTTNWGLNTYLGMEAYQQNVTADDSTRFAQFTVGSIQFEQIPEPGVMVLLVGALGLLFAGYRLRQRGLAK